MNKSLWWPSAARKSANTRTPLAERGFLLRSLQSLSVAGDPGVALRGLKPAPAGRWLQERALARPKTGYHRRLTATGILISCAVTPTSRRIRAMMKSHFPGCRYGRGHSRHTTGLHGDGSRNPGAAAVDWESHCVACSAGRDCPDPATAAVAGRRLLPASDRQPYLWRLAPVDRLAALSPLALGLPVAPDESTAPHTGALDSLSCCHSDYAVATTGAVPAEVHRPLPVVIASTRSDSDSPSFRPTSRAPDQHRRLSQ